MSVIFSIEMSESDYFYDARKRNYLLFLARKTRKSSSFSGFEK